MCRVMVYYLGIRSRIAWECNLNIVKNLLWEVFLGNGGRISPKAKYLEEIDSEQVP